MHATNPRSGLARVLSVYVYTRIYNFNIIIGRPARGGPRALGPLRPSASRISDSRSAAEDAVADATSNIHVAARPRRAVLGSRTMEGRLVVHV
jgi:hypothetical protein